MEYLRRRIDKRPTSSLIELSAALDKALESETPND
jgi:hypothetical protein